MKPPQQKYKELKRLNIRIAVELHNAFKAATASQGKEMTPILLEFIEQYVTKHMPAALPKKAGRK
jgi:predicted HicB family RNase H-like nuclease